MFSGYQALPGNSHTWSSAPEDSRLHKIVSGPSPRVEIWRQSLPRRRFQAEPGNEVQKGRHSRAGGIPVGPASVPVAPKPAGTPALPRIGVRGDERPAIPCSARGGPTGVFTIRRGTPDHGRSSIILIHTLRRCRSSPRPCCSRFRPCDL